MKENKRVIYFDILNILAIVAVVSMHCNGIVHTNPMVRAWDTSLIVDCVMYWAVPVFFMLTGANLLKYRDRYSTKVFFKKRFLKVLVPFIFWGIIMFFWKTLSGQLVINDYSIKNILNLFFANAEEPTYYFMFEILGIYLTIPMLSLLIKDDNRKALWFTIILYIIFNSLLPNILILIGITYNSSLSVQMGGYIVYVLLGYLLSTEKLEKKYIYLIYILGIFGLLFRYFTTYILSKNAGSVVTITWGYTQWHCLFLSMAIFVFIKNLNIKCIEKKNSLCNLISKIASCSFGVYLIHFIIRQIYISLFNINVYSWTFRTFGVLVVYCVSLILVYLIKKIPILRKFVP